MENNTTSGNAQGISTPMGLAGSPIPHKKWDDQTDSEKLETLRGEIRMNQYLIRRVGELEARVHQLTLHEHGENGKLVIPFQSTNAIGASTALAQRSFDPLA